MRNFVFHNPTKIIFGQDALGQTGEQTASVGTKALLVSGRGSLKGLGIYQAVHQSLRQAGIEVIEHAGVQPNPTVSHVQQGVALAQKNGIEVIVAMGGGSVMDSAKAIAAGTLASHDVWGFFKGKKSIKAALPVIAVPTVAGSGSETNNGMVLTNESTNQKIGIGNRQGGSRDFFDFIAVAHLAGMRQTILVGTDRTNDDGRSAFSGGLHGTVSAAGNNGAIVRAIFETFHASIDESDLAKQTIFRSQLE